MDKKIAIIGMGAESLLSLGAENLMKRAVLEVDRILNLEKAMRPDFGIVIIGDAGIGNEAAIKLMREAARLEVPIVVCSQEQKLDILAMEEGEMSKILTEFRGRKDFSDEIMKLEITRLPEMHLPTAEFLRDENNSFGGHKKGRNRKLRRR